MKRLKNLIAVFALTSCGMLSLSGCDGASGNTVVEPLEGPDPSVVEEKTYEQEMKKQSAES